MTRVLAMTRHLAVVVARLGASAPTAARAAAPPAIPDPAEPSATAWLERGLAAYARGEYRDAAAHFERSYALQPDPATLYAWAQALREAGDCAAAIDRYQRFLEAGASGDSRAAAIANQQRCRESLAATPEPPPPRPIVHPAPTRTTTPEPPRPTAALALLGTGTALVVVGLALVLTGEFQRRAQRRTRDYDRFDALDHPIDGLYLGGGLSLGIGGVLATTGGILLGRSRRAR